MGVPRRLLGLMEPLGLTFDDLGKMLYLLYCGTDQIKNSDRYAVEAARTLHAKGLLHWYTDTETVDFSPMFDKINENLGQPSAYLAADSREDSADAFNYAQMVKKLEQTLGVFLSIRDKQNLQEAVQRYSWSYGLVYEIYLEYYRAHRRQYDFGFFCRMAYGAQVHDLESFRRFAEGLDSVAYKTTEVLRRLGQKNNPTEPQKEMYLKWTAEWKFSHEMVLMAVETTTSARNPSFAYIDAVLREWMEKGITDPEALRAAQDRRAQEKRQSDGEGKKKSAPRKFKPEDRDLSFLER